MKAYDVGPLGNFKPVILGTIDGYYDPHGSRDMYLLSPYRTTQVCNRDGKLLATIFFSHRHGKLESRVDSELH
jgi:hypothetical protein